MAQHKIKETIKRIVRFFPMKNRTFHYVILFVLLTVYHSFDYCRVATGITSVWPCFVSWYFEKKKKEMIAMRSVCPELFATSHTSPPPKGWNERRVGVIVLHVLRQNTERKEHFFLFFLLKKRNVELVFSCRKKDGNGMLFHRDFWTINSFFFL